MWYNKSLSKGFSPLIIVIAVLAAGIIGVAGYTVATRNASSKSSVTTVGPDGATAAASDASSPSSASGSAGSRSSSTTSKGGQPALSASGVAAVKATSQNSTFSTNYIQGYDKLNADEKAYITPLAQNDFNECLKDSNRSLIGGFAVIGEYQGKYVAYNAACTDSATHVSVKYDQWVEAGSFKGTLTCDVDNDYQIPKALFARANPPVTTCLDTAANKIQDIPY